MKVKYNENVSSLEANYEVVSLDSSYNLKLTEIEISFYVECQFALDSDVYVEVSVTCDLGEVTLSGTYSFQDIANYDTVRIELEEMNVKDSHVEDDELEKILQDIADSYVEIKYKA